MTGQPGIRSRFATLTILVPPETPKILQGDFMVTTEDREIELECISVGGKPAAEVSQSFRNNFFYVFQQQHSGNKDDRQIEHLVRYSMACYSSQHKSILKSFSHKIVSVVRFVFLRRRRRLCFTRHQRQRYRPIWLSISYISYKIIIARTASCNTFFKTKLAEVDFFQMKDLLAHKQTHAATICYLTYYE